MSNVLESIGASGNCLNPQSQEISLVFSKTQEQGRDKGKLKHESKVGRLDGDRAEGSTSSGR